MKAQETTARVLVVDNDPRVCDDLEIIFDDAGLARCAICGQGQEVIDRAVDAAQSFRPHVAVIDLRLRNDYEYELSGLELLEPMRSARIIFYSAYLETTVTRTLSRYDSVTWIGKEDDPQLLVDAVDDAAANMSARHNGIKFIWSEDWGSSRIALPSQSDHKVGDIYDVYDLILQLFPNTLRVRIAPIEKSEEQQSSSAIGKSVVILVFPDNYQPSLVKLSTAEEICQEQRNYLEFIDRRIPGLYHTRLERSIIFWDDGAVAYSFLGNTMGKLSTFSAFYNEETDPDAILRPLSHFFQEVWQGYYAKAGDLDSSTLFDEYNRTLKLDNKLAKIQSDPAIGNDQFLIDPASWLQQNHHLSHIADAKSCVTHGDLHGDNLFVDDGHAWVIDFERTGPGHHLRDFAELEVDILTRLVPDQDEDAHILQLYVDILAENGDLCGRKPCSAVADNPELNKAFCIVQGLRRLAKDVTRYTDSREYIWSLLFDTLFVSGAKVTESSQKKRALILASLLCEHLQALNGD